MMIIFKRRERCDLQATAGVARVALVAFFRSRSALSSDAMRCTRGDEETGTLGLVAALERVSGAIFGDC